MELRIMNVQIQNLPQTRHHDGFYSFACCPTITGNERHLVAMEDKGTALNL